MPNTEHTGNHYNTIATMQNDEHSDASTKNCIDTLQNENGPEVNHALKTYLHNYSIHNKEINRWVHPVINAQVNLVQHFIKFLPHTSIGRRKNEDIPLTYTFLVCLLRSLIKSAHWYWWELYTQNVQRTTGMTNKLMGGTSRWKRWYG